MRRAEEMLSTVLDELLQSEDLLGGVIDQLLGPVGWRTPAKWALKQSLKTLASLVSPLIKSAMESEGTTVTVNGRAMSGREASKAFGEWRQALKARVSDHSAARGARLEL